MYQQNALEFDEQATAPVAIWKKSLGWGIIVFLNILCIFQVLVWSLKQQADTGQYDTVDMQQVDPNNVLGGSLHMEEYAKQRHKWDDLRDER